MKIATVDVQGVICITIMTITLEGFLYPYNLPGWSNAVMTFHIGVGSNVVCSTSIDNVRALVRGDRQ